ncbi:MAG: M2 family metallopeptidase [Proteobacteria bacterium]|nr:M2 family metallopeptidase [Pseudomonadota bacterium]
MLKTVAGLAGLAGALALAGAAPAAPAGSHPESPEQFLARTTRDLEVLQIEQAAATWTALTYITPDTQLLNARGNDRYLARLTQAVEESHRFDGRTLAPATARAFLKMRLNAAAPAPHDPAQRARMTTLAAALDARYGEGKYCPHGPPSCQNLDQLEAVLAHSRDYGELTEAWKGWHDIGAGMRGDYTEFVALANQGAREQGFQDLGAMWRSGYDMPPAQFEADTERLWQQVKPLYDSLHCYARAKLAAHYGADKVPPAGPIPAQLLGNMWAQQWNNLYADLLVPYPAAHVQTADAALKAQQWDARRMTESAQGFYTSLGFPPLPPTFWERSMLTRPRDREVVCHPSAWDMAPGDVRVKACLEPTAEDLATIYHELGHVYYFLSYAGQPLLFRDGANDGFHEAVGDAVNLSVTPAYLAARGLVPPAAGGHDALIDQQMSMALEKIAFLPFARFIDLWRWQVFSGQITPADYNARWWALSRQYQGIVPPVPRTEADFDPGAKFHIADNTPYIRYFLAFIVQFQFHKAMCAAAGFEGPLYACSVYGNPAAGARLHAMLAAGASQPWQDTLQKLTGTRDFDAGAILEYFQPLREWLAQENQGRQCGW